MGGSPPLTFCKKDVYGLDVVQKIARLSALTRLQAPASRHPRAPRYISPPAPAPTRHPTSHTAVPIIASRVTRVASCSADQPSVPSGRAGRTRKRRSAVASCTASLWPRQRHPKLREAWLRAGATRPVARVPRASREAQPEALREKPARPAHLQTRRGRVADVRCRSRGGAWPGRRHRARAEGGRLVPRRRGSEERSGVAGAERAHDQIVCGGIVLDHDDLRRRVRVGRGDA